MAINQAVLLENDQVKKTPFMGLITQTLAGKQQGLETLEVRYLTLPPGLEIPVSQHYGEVVALTMQGRGRAVVGEAVFDLVPDTTLIIPAKAPRQVRNTGDADLVVLLIRSMVPPGEKTMAEIMRERL